MCEHGIEECPELTVCDGCLKDAKIKRAMEKRDSEDIGNEEGSGIPSTTRPNFVDVRVVAAQPTARPKARLDRGLRT